MKMYVVAGNEFDRHYNEVLYLFGITSSMEIADKIRREVRQAGYSHKLKIRICEIETDKFNNFVVFPVEYTYEDYYGEDD